MTDKELRKLSRLELLELLLQASKENKKLTEQIEKLKAENKTTQNIENLSLLTNQVENVLKYANSITDTLKTADRAVVPQSDSSAVSRSEETANQSTAVLSDKEIYTRILCFFSKNDEKLSVFPADIENDIRTRINSILKK